MSEKEIELNNPDVFAQPAEQPETENNETEAETQESVSEEPEVSEETESHVTFIEADGEPQADEPIEEESGGESELLDDNSRELNEEQVEQLSLLDGQLPHLEAANAPDPHKAKAVLEGLLFITGDEGVTAEQAATALDITPELAAEYFDELMEEYTDDNRGIEIANYAGTYRFLSKAFVFDYAKRLFQITKTAQLSQAALETLAIIAYKQPITRVEIEEIRGVGADMMLRKLMARDLIRESGRSEAAGRPILYEVTEEFMNSFKLLSLKELPELPSFSNEEESEELFNQ
jgi:segregation and condensation protein B